MTPTLTLDPYRFSTDPTAMTAFLEALGMAREVSSAEGRFVHLVAGAGSVAVHLTDAGRA